jgi:poly-D-alanine transfer protein DltD
MAKNDDKFDPKAVVRNLPKDKKQALREEIEKSELEEHIENEKNKIKDIKCLDCKTRLRVKPEDIFKRVKNNKTYRRSHECPKCNLYNRVTVTYLSTIEESEGKIELKRNGFGFQNKIPMKMTEEERNKWIGEEARKIRNNTSGPYPDYLKITILCLDDILNPKAAEDDEKEDDNLPENDGS